MALSFDFYYCLTYIKLFKIIIKLILLNIIEF
jgi:hypothetical protein